MQKKTGSRLAATDASLDLSLQDVLDGLEDDLLIIDSEYRVMFANSAARSRPPKGLDSPIGRIC